jgi:hypothetical protein
MTMAFDFKKIFACQKMLTGAPHLEIQASGNAITALWHTGILAKHPITR